MINVISMLVIIKPEILLDLYWISLSFEAQCVRYKSHHGQSRGGQHFPTNTGAFTGGDRQVSEHIFSFTLIYSTATSIGRSCSRFTCHLCLVADVMVFSQSSYWLFSLFCMHSWTVLLGLCRVPESQQRIGGFYLSLVPQLRSLYVTYCSNHPSAVNVLTQHRCVTSQHNPQTTQTHVRALADQLHIWPCVCVCVVQWGVGRVYGK